MKCSRVVGLATRKNRLNFGDDLYICIRIQIQEFFFRIDLMDAIAL